MYKESFVQSLTGIVRLILERLQLIAKYNKVLMVIVAVTIL